ncbi:elongator complex protein 3 [Geobacter anodireducens]|uniref:Radical SAM protein n=1 Tax=Geobacter soli TaxID=1510391 RepID=A0A0C1TLR1_9BACT|nr:radical SAM protein [Geobacter soli]KIE41829.1 radical SAM protein [Geobacter soli]
MTRPVIVPFFISHQGCPHRCVFCDQERIAGRTGGLPTAAEIHSAVKAFGRGRPVEAAFYGGTFTSLPRSEQERLLTALQPLRHDGSVRSVRLSTRPDALDAETAGFLKSMGVASVELGVQSMDDRVLAASGRGHSAADTVRAFEVLRREGIAAGAQLMPGLPGDSRERSLDSLTRIFDLKPVSLRIYPTLVVAGTRLAELWAEGSYTPLTLADAVPLCADMLLACKRAGVPVIRLGLQPTDILERSVLAGPWHPALRQLVEGELWYRLLERLTAGLAAGTEVSVACAPARISDVVGQRRANLSRLLERRGTVITGVAGCPAAAPDTLTLTHAGGTVAGGLTD